MTRFEYDDSDVVVVVGSGAGGGTRGQRALPARRSRPSSWRPGRT